MEVPKRTKQRSRKSKHPADGPDYLQPAVSSSSLDGSLPYPRDEGLSADSLPTCKSGSMSEYPQAANKICTNTHGTPAAQESSGTAEPASSAAAIMAAASGMFSFC